MPSISYREIPVSWGDTLPGLARTHMGNADSWRDIAWLNALDHPYVVEQGAERSFRATGRVRITRRRAAVRPAYFIARGEEAVAATGYVAFERGSGIGDISIQYGDLVSTESGPLYAEFFVAATTILPAADSIVMVPVRCTATGEIGNAAVGAINTIVNTDAGIGSVINIDEFDTGRNGATIFQTAPIRRRGPLGYAQTEGEDPPVILRYYATEDVTMGVEDHVAWVTIEAESYGPTYNMAAFWITQFTDPALNCSYNVTNPSYIDGGRFLNVVAPGDKILVPSSPAGRGTSTRRDTATAQNYYANLLGRDVMLDKSGDIGQEEAEVTGLTDTAIRSGMQNLAQALRIRLATYMGRLTREPSYGSEVLGMAGKALTPTNRDRIRLAAEVTLRSDPRVEDITRLDIFIAENVVVIDARVTAIGQTDPESLNIVVRRGAEG